MSSPFYRIQLKSPKWLFVPLSVLLACGVFSWGIYWFIELRPVYLELTPPPHESMIWLGYTERSIVNWDDGGTYYLWRQEAICAKSECGSKNDVLDYFDEWLESEGWRPFSLYNPCRIVIPEMNLLEEVENGTVVYWPSNTEDWNFSASVCLAIYDTSTEDAYWSIALGTTNPSFITELINDLD